jgi:hypothetical protein
MQTHEIPEHRVMMALIYKGRVIPNRNVRLTMLGDNRHSDSCSIQGALGHSDADGIRSYLD